MRQIRISKAGPPEALTVKEARDPEVQNGEMRVRVEACGVNFADVMGCTPTYLGFLSCRAMRSLDAWTRSAAESMRAGSAAMCSH
jgi:hypothetical protein